MLKLGKALPCLCSSPFLHSFLTFGKMSHWSFWLRREIDFLPPCCSVDTTRIAQRDIDILTEQET